MRNCNKSCTSALFSFIEPVPQILRILANVRSKRKKLLTFFCSIRAYNYSMKVYTHRNGAPLPAEESSKITRIIMSVCSFNNIVPCQLRSFSCISKNSQIRDIICRMLNWINMTLKNWILINSFVHLPESQSAFYIAIPTKIFVNKSAFVNGSHDTQHLSMIGNYQKI